MRCTSRIVAPGEATVQSATTAASLPALSTCACSSPTHAFNSCISSVFVIPVRSLSAVDPSAVCVCVPTSLVRSLLSSIAVGPRLNVRCPSSALSGVTCSDRPLLWSHWCTAAALALHPYGGLTVAAPPSAQPALSIGSISRQLTAPTVTQSWTSLSGPRLRIHCLLAPVWSLHLSPLPGASLLAFSHADPPWTWPPSRTPQRLPRPSLRVYAVWPVLPPEV